MSTITQSTIGRRTYLREYEYFLYGDTAVMAEAMRQRGQHAHYEVSLFKQLGEINWWPQIIDLLMQHKRASEEVRVELKERIAERIRQEELIRGVLWSDDERSDLLRMARMIYEQ